MERYLVKRIFTSPLEKFSWIVIDTNTYLIARLNDTLLECLTEKEADRMASTLNRLDVATQFAGAR